ncbi:MAG: radical SAM family heme chaperone HemW [Acidimicrobiia bacterium]
MNSEQPATAGRGVGAPRTGGARGWGPGRGGEAASQHGAYVHVPFCENRCDYCDFATWTDRAHLMERYAQACVADVRRRRRSGQLAPATSVFFGGGTPSLLPAELLTAILGAIPRLPDAEVTVECNPDAVDAAKLDAYRAAGVNRLSFGVQSFEPRVLACLGRTHNPDNVAAALGAARAAGFTNINVDLIYGAPAETATDWLATLEAALAFAPEHVSAYALTVEPGTPLHRRILAGGAVAPDEDDQADRYLAADAVLSRAGLSWYEISNWAQPGRECRHNQLYWAQGDYTAIGCAAHGHSGGRRWWNVRTPERYIALVEGDKPTEAGSETLDSRTRAAEALALALRTRRGAATDDDAGLVDDGLAEWCWPPLGPGASPEVDRRLVLTLTGRLLANEATVRLQLAGDQLSARS